MIKTFPLRFTEEYLNEIGEAAEGYGISKEKFILKAIHKALSEYNNSLYSQENTERNDL